MSPTVTLSADENTLQLQLEECDLTERLLEETPFETRISTWGGEIYFPIPIEAESENLTDKVEIGDVTYWPEGQSLAIFFGPTPQGGDAGGLFPTDEVELMENVRSGLDRLEDLTVGDDITLSSDS